MIKGARQKMRSVLLPLALCGLGLPSALAQTGTGAAGTGGNSANGGVGGAANGNNGAAGSTGNAGGVGTGAGNGPGGTGVGPGAPSTPGAATATTPGTNTNVTNGGQSPAQSNAPGVQNGTMGTSSGAQGNLPLTGNTTAQTYTLAQTIAAALQSSSELQIAARNIQIDRKRADEAAAAGRPNLGTGASATRFDQATKVSIGGSPPVQVIGNHTETLSLNLGERLDLTGQIRAASSQAQLQSLVDLFVYEQTRNQRILRAKTIYFDLLRAEHQVDVAQAALNTAVAQQTIAQQLNANQVGQQIDVYRANTQVATAQQQLTQALNNRDVARNNFNDLIGRPLDAPSAAQDVPGVDIGFAVPNANTPISPPTPQSGNLYTAPPADISGIDLNRSLASALRQRPEVLAGQVNVRVAETGIKLARAGLEPTLRLDAAGDYYPTTSFQFPRQRTAEITATVNIPIYDGGATRDRVDEARLRTQNAQTSLASTQENVSLDVRTAYTNLLTAARQIDAANTAVQQAVAARQLAQIRYEGQVALYLEVTDAQAALVQAENNQVDAVYNYLIARAQFQNAIGAPQTQ